MKTTNWNWREFSRYFLMLLAAGFGISLILIKTVEIPENFGLSAKSNYDPFFVFGCGILMIITPVLAGLLRWRIKEFLVAFALATGLLMGNLGFGIGFTLLAPFIYLIGIKGSELVAYYHPKITKEDGAEQLATRSEPNLERGDKPKQE